MALGLLRLKDNELELTGAGIPPAYIYRNNSGVVEEIPLKGLLSGAILILIIKRYLLN
jgi:serine phosphatase RsbU (regulator of sigma subunit)